MTCPSHQSPRRKRNNCVKVLRSLSPCTVPSRSFLAHYPALGLVHFLLDSVFETKAGNGEQPGWMDASIRSMLAKISEYAPLLLDKTSYLGHLLDPRLKEQYLYLRSWQYEDNLQWVEQLMSSDYPLDPCLEQPQNAVSQPTAYMEKVAAKKRRVAAPTETRTCSEELQKYLANEPCPLNDKNLLYWWRINGVKYPRLSAMARDYLAVQATSVPSKQLFSKAGDVVTKKRASLSPSTIQATLCLQSWARMVSRLSFNKGRAGLAA